MIFPGQIYKHKKGGTYRILYLAKHTETGEQMVIYQSLEYKRIWARPLDNFLEPGRFALIKDIDNCTEHMNIYSYEVCSTFKPQYTGSAFCDCGYIKDLHE